MAKNKVLVKGSQLVTEDGIKNADLLIEEGKISKIESQISASSGIQLIKANNFLTFPGFIEPHMSLSYGRKKFSFSEDFKSISQSAAAGGFTSIIYTLFPPSEKSASHLIKEKKDNASCNSLIDFSFHLYINGREKKLHEYLNTALSHGITSVEFSMLAGEKVRDNELLKLFKKSAAAGALVMVHPQNKTIREKTINSLIKKGKKSPAKLCFSLANIIEREAVSRACMFARESKAPVYIRNLSAGKAASDIRKLKREGHDIFAQSCPHYLILNKNAYKKKNGYLYYASPPLRTPNDNYQMWRAVFEGTLDVISSDYSPFLRKEKKYKTNDPTKTPAGVGDIENLFSLLYTHGSIKREVNPESLMRLTSLNPAKIFGLYPRKGVIKEGSDADLVLFNPNKKRTIKSPASYSNCDWSAYRGMKVTGYPEITISRGEIIYDKNKIKKTKSRALFLKRKTET
ncbi:MAG: amidohydrolase family protein [Elusimicrobiota bacterium]